jgi:hypothetical protein
MKVCVSGFWLMIVVLLSFSNALSRKMKDIKVFKRIFYYSQIMLAKDN